MLKLGSEGGLSASIICGFSFSILSVCFLYNNLNNSFPVLNLASEVLSGLSFLAILFTSGTGSSVCCGGGGSVTSELNATFAASFLRTGDGVKHSEAVMRLCPSFRCDIELELRAGLF